MHDTNLTLQKIHNEAFRLRGSLTQALNKHIDSLDDELKAAVVFQGISFFLTQTVLKYVGDAHPQESYKLLNNILDATKKSLKENVKFKARHHS